LDLHAVAQRNNVANSRRAANTEAAQNLFSRFFQLTARSKTPFLVACLLEFHFEDIRKGALKAMKSSFREMHKAFPIDTLTNMLGFNDDFDTAAFVQACKLESVLDHITGLPSAVKVHNRAIFDGSQVPLLVVHY
jgi:nuclear mRNA export protein SAC3